MRLTLAIMVAFILGVTAPVFAQSPNQGVSNQGDPNAASQVGPDGEPLDNPGVGALAQDVPPPPPNLGALAIGGLAVGAIVTGVVIATNNKSNNNNTTTPAPASP